MAFSLNRIMLIGNLGQDAKHDFNTNNTCITSFSIATTHGYKGKDGNYQNETTWHGCTGFNLPDFLKEKLVKGAKFYVEGRLKKEEWKDKDGNQQKTTKVIIEKLIPLESRGGTSHQEDNQGTVGSYETAPETDDSPDLPF